MSGSEVRIARPVERQAIPLFLKFLSKWEEKMAYISCENLVVGYDGKAVSPPVSFTVEKGSYVCILGENGSGKTTLMRTLVGLQKKISGEFLFGDGLCKNETGYLPQKLSVSADFPGNFGQI